MNAASRLTIVLVVVTIANWYALARVRGDECCRTSTSGPSIAPSGAPARTGSIAGVVKDDAGAPVRMASVTLSARELGTNRSKPTDQNGRFIFAGLPPGRYQLSAHKPGYVRTGYGARSPGRPGIAIPLALGQNLDSLNIVLARGAVITGAVLDEHGDPAVGMAVRAQRVVLQDGERRLQQVSGDVTDDRGMYRVFQLPPGRYFISAVKADADAGAPVFYPGTWLVSAALPVTVSASEEQAGVDFRTHIIRTSTIEGQIIGSELNGCQDVAVALVPIAAGPDAVADEVQVVHSEGGRFGLSDVRPGDYHVSARCMVPPSSRSGERRILWARQPISVAGKDIRDVALNLRSGVTVSGLVSFDGMKGHADTVDVRVMLVPRGPEFREIGSEPLTARVDSSGPFTISGVPPGVYEIEASGDSRWSLASALIDGRDALDFFLEVQPEQGVHGAMLTFTNRRQQISGTLVDSGGWPAVEYRVIAFPTDNRFWIPDNRRIVSTRPDASGRFIFSSLPAGTYHIAALTDVSVNELYDAEFLKQVVAASVAVTLSLGGTAIQHIRVGR